MIAKKFIIMGISGLALIGGGIGAYSVAQSNSESTIESYFESIDNSITVENESLTIALEEAEESATVRSGRVQLSNTEILDRVKELLADKKLYSDEELQIYIDASIDVTELINVNTLINSELLKLDVAAESMTIEELVTLVQEITINIDTIRYESIENNITYYTELGNVRVDYKLNNFYTELTNAGIDTTIYQGLVDLIDSKKSEIVTEDMTIEELEVYLKTVKAEINEIVYNYITENQEYFDSIKDLDINYKDYKELVKEGYISKTISPKMGRPTHKRPRH